MQLKKNTLSTLSLFLYSHVYIFAGGPGSGRHKSDSDYNGNNLSAILLLVFLFISLSVAYAIYKKFEIQRSRQKEKLEKERLLSLLTKEHLLTGEIEQLEDLVNDENTSPSKFEVIVNSLLKRKNLLDKYGSDIGAALYNGNYFIGMTEEQLIDSKGQPTKIETENLKTKTKRIFIYGNKNSGDVFNFVDGKLERFKHK